MVPVFLWCTFPISPPVAACDQLAVFRLLFFVQQLHDIVRDILSQCVDLPSHRVPHVAHLGLTLVQDRINCGTLVDRQAESFLKVVGLAVSSPVTAPTVTLIRALASTTLVLAVFAEGLPRRSADSNSSREYREQKCHCP